MGIKKTLIILITGAMITTSILGCGKSQDEKDIEKIQKEIEDMEQENKEVEEEKEKDGVLSVQEIMEDRENGFRYMRELNLDDEKYFNGDIIVHGYVQALSGDVVTLSSAKGGDSELYCYNVTYGNDLKEGDKVYIRGYLSDNNNNTLKKAKIINDKDIDKELKLLEAKREELKKMKDTKYDVVALINELKNDKEAFWEKYYGAVITITGVKAEVGVVNNIYLVSSENVDLNNFNQDENISISFSSSQDIETAKEIDNGKTITAIGRLLPVNEDDEETLFDVFNAQLVK